MHMNFRNPYWDYKTKMQLLERWILIHSIIYYELDSNVVSDEMFDKNCVQLVKLIKSFPKEFEKTKYHKVFKSFDGSTGFDLYSKLSREDQKYLRTNAEQVISLGGKKPFRGRAHYINRKKSIYK